MADGFTPAFMAARTRFALAGLTVSDARLLLEACGGFAVVAGAGFEGRVNVRCRRAASAATPADSRANSSSLRMASEGSKFDGKSNLAVAGRVVRTGA